MKLTIEIASVPDRNDVVAEIWWSDEMVAELYRSANGVFQIDIYPSKLCGPWSFDLASWLVALTEAQQKLS